MAGAGTVSLGDGGSRRGGGDGAKVRDGSAQLEPPVCMSMGMGG